MPPFTVEFRVLAELSKSSAIRSHCCAALTRMVPLGWARFTALGASARGTCERMPHAVVAPVSYPGSPDSIWAGLKMPNMLPPALCASSVCVLAGDSRVEQMLSPYSKHVTATCCGSTKVICDRSVHGGMFA
jgi:hypothetical protein